MQATPEYKHLVGHRESVGEGGLVIGDAEQVLVRNDNQRIDAFLQLLDTRFGQAHAPLTFEVERLGDHADGENALVAGRLGNNRGSTGAGAAAHAGGDEAHVGAIEVIDDLINALFGCRAPDFRLRTRAKTFGHRHAKLDQPVGLGHGQRLGVGVGDNEVDALQSLH
jgi:hypothetical protein